MTYDITLADIAGMMSATRAGSMKWHWVPHETSVKRLPEYASSTDIASWAATFGDSVILDSTMGHWDIRLEKDVEYDGSKQRFTLDMHAGTTRRSRELSPFTMMRSKREDAETRIALDELYLLVLPRAKRWSKSLLPTEAQLVDGFHTTLTKSD